METSLISGAASATCNALRLAELKTIAHVVVDSNRVLDLAVDLGMQSLAVVRCVGWVADEDHTALATMVSQGDFAWAGLVYSSDLRTDWPGDNIEAFHVSDLPRLVERLQALQHGAAP